MIIWLDVKNSSIPRVFRRRANEFFLGKDDINNSDLTKFISDVEKLNTTTSPDTLRLYLLNQENIANYNDRQANKEKTKTFVTGLKIRYK